MEVKNYYRVLGVEPSATLSEIRKAYHNLAMRYHPDKNPGDSNATAYFSEIKEAYEVLKDPSRKEFYLQQRWYERSRGKKEPGGILTPVSLLKRALELDRYLSLLDIHRMDREGLFQYLMELIDDATVEKLIQYGDREVNTAIAKTLLNCLEYIEFERLETASQQILRISDDPAITENINSYTRKRYTKNRRDKYSIWLILVAVLCISLLIYFVSQ